MSGHRPRAPAIPSQGLARVMSKMGLASRTRAAAWIRDGRVTLNGKRITDPEHPVRGDVDRIAIDSAVTTVAERVVVMLNKPRGLVTTAADEQGRDTVYRCLEGAGLPWLAPVGRLDKASEGLLLLSNDPAWAARVTQPPGAPRKTYHVQIDRVPDEALVASLLAGARADGEPLRVAEARVLRSGTRHGWLELTLDEGRNRHIRRLLSAHEVAVLRLVRVAIGPLALGELGKGAWRRLDRAEIDALVPPP